MNVQNILTTISDEEIIVLSGDNGSVAIDNTDKVEVIDGKEIVFIKTSIGTVPVPASEFDEATVMTQEEFIIHCILDM